MHSPFKLKQANSINFLATVCGIVTKTTICGRRDDIYQPNAEPSFAQLTPSLYTFNVLRFASGLSLLNQANITTYDSNGTSFHVGFCGRGNLSTHSGGRRTSSNPETVVDDRPRDVSTFSWILRPFGSRRMGSTPCFCNSSCTDDSV